MSGANNAEFDTKPAKYLSVSKFTDQTVKTFRGVECIVIKPSPSDSNRLYDPSITATLIKFSNAGVVECARIRGCIVAYQVSHQLHPNFHYVFAILGIPMQ